MNSYLDKWKNVGETLASTSESGFEGEEERNRKTGGWETKVETELERPRKRERSSPREIRALALSWRRQRDSGDPLPVHKYSVPG